MIARFSSLGPFRYSAGMNLLVVKRLIWSLIALLLLVAEPVLAQEAEKLDQAQRLEVETLLDKLGFDPGKVDGIFDDDTRFALRAYQDFAALTPDGEADVQLLRELRSVAAAVADLPPVEGPEEPTAASTPSGESADELAQAAAESDPEETPALTAQEIPEPPAQKPEPPEEDLAAQETPRTKAQDPAQQDPVQQEPAQQVTAKQEPAQQEPAQDGTGFDLGGLLDKLSTSGAEPGTEVATDDAAVRQQALFRAQNRELFAQAYGAGKSRQYGLAIASYEDLAERPGLNHQEKAVVFFNLGNLWLELANNLRALESYDSALELAPAFREGHCNRALVLGRLGQEREAENGLAEAKRLGLACSGQPRPSFQSLALSSGI